MVTATTPSDILKHFDLARGVDTGPADFVKTINGITYRGMRDNEKVPDYKQYTNIEAVGDGEIRFTYTNDQGKEIKRKVFEDDSQFGEVKADLDVFEVVEEAKAGKDHPTGKGWEIIEKFDEIPNPVSSYYTEPEGLGDRVMLVEYTDDKGTRRWGIAVRDLDPDMFGRVKDGQAAGQLVVDNREEGYAVISSADDLPKITQFTNFSTPGEHARGGDEGLAFEYVDENGDAQKGLVLKSVDEDAFEAASEKRDLFVSQKNFLDHENDRLDPEKDPEFITVAGPGNYYKQDEEVDSYFVEQTAWMDVESMDERFGDDALLVTTYDSDKRENMVDRKIVYREDIGDEKFERLQNVKNTDKYLDFFEGHATQDPSTYHPERNVRVWTKDKFKSSELNEVSRVSTDFMDRGFIILEFNDSGSGPYVGQTIVISEHKSPEAFAIARGHAQKDSTTKMNLMMAPGSEEWINLRDNNQFP